VVSPFSPVQRIRSKRPMSKLSVDRSAASPSVAEVVVRPESITILSTNAKKTPRYALHNSLSLLVFLYASVLFLISQHASWCVLGCGNTTPEMPPFI
jgi:hypothetical protein